MKITVSKQDILDGVQGDSGNCPVALALKRQTHWKNIQVGRHYILTSRKTFRTPPEVQVFIESFDNTEDEFSGAFEFDLDPEMTHEMTEETLSLQLKNFSKLKGFLQLNSPNIARRFEFLKLETLTQVGAPTDESTLESQANKQKQNQAM